jgi:hypothetical protein
MTTLQIPLHMPVKQTEQLLLSELYDREVVSVKVTRGSLVIRYERKTDESHFSVGC